MPPPDRLPDRTREALHGTEPRSPLDWAATLRDADLPSMVRQARAEGRARLAFQPEVPLQPLGQETHRVKGVVPRPPRPARLRASGDTAATQR